MKKNNFYKGLLVLGLAGAMVLTVVFARPTKKTDTDIVYYEDLYVDSNSSNHLQEEVQEEAQEEVQEEVSTEVPAEVSAGQLAKATAQFIPGIYTATAPSFQDNPLTLSVTFSDDQIVSAQVLEHGDSKYGSGWWFRAMPAVLDQIVVHQSTKGVDTFTGATITQTAVVSAFEDTIRQAGADPYDLVPQVIDVPLEGDLFVPGFLEIIVEPNTLDIYGNRLTEGATRMLYSQDTPMVARFSFGRNDFHMHTGNALEHGESTLAVNNVENPADAIGGGTWGSWFFRQMVQHQINDRQTTQNIDIHTGATMSASGIVWAANQGIMESGATPAYVTGRTTPPTQITRNPAWDANMPFFVPGIYTVTKEGFGGPMEIEVTLDRTLIRRIQILEENETPSFLDMVWGGEADHVLRNAIFTAQWAGLDDIDVVSGATVTSQGIIDAVRTAGQQAWVE